MWKTVKLGEICHVQRGTTITKKNTVDGVVPVIGGGTKPTYFHNEANREPGCITVSGSGASAGFVNYWVSPIFASDCSTIEIKTNDFLQRFVYYFMQSQQQYIYENFRSGAAQPHVYAKDIATLDLPVIPLSEQQRIIAKLDAVFAEIDGAIEAVAKSVDDVSRLLESKITDYLSNQNCSRTLTLKDVCEATQGVQIAKSNHSGEKLDGYARYLYISDFSHDKNIKYVKNDYPKKTVFPTDIIVVNTGASAGKIFRGIPGILSNNLFKVSPVEALINADFLYHFVNSLIFKKYQAQIMRGTANPHMGHQNFLSTPIQLPEISAQREIVEMVSCLLRHGETIQNAYIKKKISLSSLKLAILEQELQSETA